ncbi:NifU family protein [bacterium]|nr:NifU family protein [bacterium]
MTHEEKIVAIKEILETLEIYIQQDGGSFEFINYENNIVTIKLTGACVNCSLADQTYKEGMQELLRDEVDPNIEVEMII